MVQPDQQSATRNDRKVAAVKENGSTLYTKTVVPALVALTIAIVAAFKTTATTSNLTFPPGAVYVDPRDYNVVGANYGQWRNDSFIGFNPTNTTPPFIQVFDLSFLDVTGPDATIRLVAENAGFAFAHEAPIYVPDLNVVFFSSNDGGDLGYSDWHNNSVVAMLNMTEVDLALAQSTGDVNIQVQTLDLSETIQMVNGGTGPYKGDLLFITSGRALLPPSIVRVNPRPPYNTTVLIDNFYGRQFNSLNDIRVLPGTDLLFFTDPTYGWMNGFRPEPKLPSQVYRFDPSTGHVRVVADGFRHPNGIAFSADGRSAFIADTGVANGLFGLDQTYPATIYKFDVEPVTHAFINRRVFAYIDTGAPDGVQVDTKGNVYSGCGDGTHVWAPDGTLIGKFFVNSTSAQMIFTKSGLLILAETSVYLTDIWAKGIDVGTY